MADKIKKTCATCGSEEVRLDAWAAWDDQAQEWVLHSIYDDAFCENCEGSCFIEEGELDAGT